MGRFDINIDFLRVIGICEERGSGFDRMECEGMN